MGSLSTEPCHVFRDQPALNLGMVAGASWVSDQTTPIQGERVRALFLHGPPWVSDSSLSALSHDGHDPLKQRPLRPQPHPLAVLSTTAGRELRGEAEKPTCVCGVHMCVCSLCVGGVHSEYL